MLTLSRGEDSLVVAHENGGSIVGWTRRGTHLLRRPSPESIVLGRPGAMACFPLVPYCNRIAWRRFTWQGITHDLAANFGDHPHAIHGVGWQRAWRVETISSDAVQLSLHHDPSGEDVFAWPFAFSARVAYRLTNLGMRIEVEATNLHSTPAPMGIGLHPYFPRTADTTIAFQADGVWINSEALPTIHEPIPAAWDHAHPRRVDGEPLDNCFTGWSGVATVPGLRVEADAVFRELQVYTPAGLNFVCVEPVSHIPDAINRPELTIEQSMAVLAPGQSMRGGVTFAPTGGIAENHAVA